MLRPCRLRQGSSPRSSAPATCRLGFHPAAVLSLDSQPPCAPPLSVRAHPYQETDPMNDAALTESILADPLSAVVDYYARCLPGHPKADAFLADNRLSADGELQVGFGDRTL